jgi:DNA-binding LacI/PurR family transcriptional regulator
MVFLNRDVRGPHVASVWVDWPTATSEVVAHLAALGHRRIGLIVPRRDDARFANREDWYRPALARAGLGPDPALVFRDDISLEGGYRAGAAMLSRADPPTAAICHSDAMAIGLLEACRERGIAVPRDLSVVGWDDVPYASLVAPPLTTVRVPRHALGAAAARQLLDLLAGRPVAGEVHLPLELITRQSCQPPMPGAVPARADRHHEGSPSRAPDSRPRAASARVRRNRAAGTAPARPHGPAGRATKRS